MFILKKDFQYTTSDDQILTLNVGTKIDSKDGDHYIITKGRKEYKINKSIVENNPEFFEKVDLQTQLQAILKKNSKRTSPKTAEIIHDYLTDEYFYNKELVENDLLETMLDACRLQYMSTEDDKWLIPIQRLGWNIDSKGVFKN